MENLEIPGTYDQPAVSFNALEGKLAISGRSFSDDLTEFYHNLLTWIREYAEMPVERTSLSIRCDLLDELSLKYMVEIINELEKVGKKRQLEVEWIYDPQDEESKEAGEAIQSVVSSQITLRTSGD